MCVLTARDAFIEAGKALTGEVQTWFYEGDAASALYVGDLLSFELGVGNPGCATLAASLDPSWLPPKSRP